MNSSLIKYMIFFVVMVLLQEFVFNNIQIGTLLTPYVYILFILVLPLSVSPVLVLITSFLLGLSVDCFSTEMVGIHASACLVIGYLRRFVLKAVRTKDDGDEKFIPTIYTLPWRPYLMYTLILVFLHHATLFFLELSKIDSLPHTILRIVISSLLSSLFIVLFQLAFFKNPRS